MRARTPIEDYALIGDLHTAALISRDGSIDWLCLPRFDSAACFAALLDGPEAGHWTLQPAADPSPDLAPRPTMRAYDAHSLVLRTRWDTDSGAVDVLDFMPPRGEAADVVYLVAPRFLESFGGARTANSSCPGLTRPSTSLQRRG